MSLEEKKKKNKMSELEFYSCACSLNGVLVWFGSTFVDLANAQCSPPIYARCLPWRSLPEGLALFSFFFFFLKTDARRSILALYYQNWHFPPAWDRLFLLNVALPELRSRRLTRSDSERLAAPASVKVAQIWIFSSANSGRAHYHTLTVSFKQAEKKKSHSKQCLAKKAPQKSTESNTSCMIKWSGCPEPRARAVMIQSVYWTNYAPAWYGLAVIFLLQRRAATSWHASRVRQYTIPLPPCRNNKEKKVQ